MKRKVIRNFFVVVLVLIEITSIFLLYKSISNKETILDNVKLSEISKYNNFALMIEEDGEYIESETFPTSGYVLNEILSGCVDNNGNTIENALTYTNGTINLRTRTNAMCFLYFDIEEIYAAEYLIENVDSSVLWNSTLEDDGYRYVGTAPSNYVCFGYNDASEDCDFTSTTNTDLYAYRIIGIFEDSEGNQHLKLIKKEALNITYAWNSDYTNEVSWEDSDLYLSLNGDTFLTNTTYVPTGWSDKIETWNYTATNTNTYNSGPDYKSITLQNVYLHELNRSTNPYSIGGSSTVSAKIGLMYTSDYLLSLGSGALEYISASNKTTLKTGWMHISNNDSGSPNGSEWTMTRYGLGAIGGTGDSSYGVFYAWYVYSDGSLNDPAVQNLYSVRPVFYLKSDVELTGEGTTTNPYIIS